MTTSLSIPQAPIAIVKPHREMIHDDSLIDHYFWFTREGESGRYRYRLS